MWLFAALVLLSFVAWGRPQERQAPSRWSLPFLDRSFQPAIRVPGGRRFKNRPSRPGMSISAGQQAHRSSGQPYPPSRAADVARAVTSVRRPGGPRWRGRPS
jgi:hypothetical protein